jgi:ubiquitin C-terminal hydrolase
MKGLQNIGNTCYINSIIQILSYNPIFVNYINKHINNINHDLQSNKNKFIFLELYKIIRELNVVNNYQIIHPISFCKLLQHIWKIPIQIQQDGSDLLEFIFDQISIYFGNGDNFQFDETTLYEHHINILHDMSHRNLHLTFKNQYSEFNEIFYGQLLHNITCNECHHVENLFEIFNILHIPINDYTCLDECLDNYFDYFKPDEYSCDKCKSNDTIHKYYIWKLPKILTITLKRFDNNLYKIQNLVTVHDELSLKKYICHTLSPHLNNTPHIYSLHSIVNHHGNCNNGHYTSIVNSCNKWIIYDDEHYNLINKNKINSNENYILTYNIN